MCVEGLECLVGKSEFSRQNGSQQQQKQQTFETVTERINKYHRGISISTSSLGEEAQGDSTNTYTETPSRVCEENNISILNSSQRYPTELQQQD